MKKLFVFVLTAALCGCASSASASETSEAASESAEPQNTVSAETVTNPEGVQCQALLFPFKDENSTVIAVVMVSSDKGILSVPLTGMFDTIPAGSEYLEERISNPMQYLTIDTAGKYVGYEMYTTDWQETSALEEKLMSLSFDQYAETADKTTTEKTGEKIYVENVIAVDGVTLQDVSSSEPTVLDYTLNSDGERLYQLTGDLSFISFTVSNDIDSSVYAAQNGSWFGLYMKDSKTGSTQPLEEYIAAPGANASWSCCDTGWYHSEPYKEYTNGYRITTAHNSLGIILESDSDLAIYNAVTSKSPVIHFLDE